MKTYITCSHGRYNWASEDKQWQLRIETPHGVVSELFNNEPNLSGALPSDVLDILEERINSYLMSSSRDEQLTTIANIREHSIQVDSDYLKAKIDRKKQELAELEAHLKLVLP